MEHLRNELAMALLVAIITFGTVTMAHRHNMRRNQRRASALGALIAAYIGLTVACAVSSAPKVERAVLTHYGIFQMARAHTQDAVATSAGRVHMAEAIRLVQITDRIPRKRGTIFGYRFTASGTPTGATISVTVAIQHPPFKKGDVERSLDRDSWNQSVTLGVPSFAGWSFDDESEMVAGRWTVQVLHGNKVLVEKAFSVE